MQLVIRLTISLVKSPEFQMPVTPPRVIQHVGIRELSQERAWILRQWMKEDAVDDKACCLSWMSAISIELNNWTITLGSRRRSLPRLTRRPRSKGGLDGM